MAFAVCVLLFCAVSPLMCSLSQQMVLFSFWEASAVANRILVIAGEYVDIFSDIHSALRHKESRIQAPERGSTPAQQFERLQHYPVAASFPAEIGLFPDYIKSEIRAFCFCFSSLYFLFGLFIRCRFIQLQSPSNLKQTYSSAALAIR